MGMATVTARILAGYRDTFRPDLRPTHGLSLFEISRPSRALAPLEGCPVSLEVFPGRIVRRGTL